MNTLETQSQNTGTGLISSKLHERLLSGEIRFDLSRKNSNNRNDVENYIAEQFYKEHGAKLMHFMPCLLTMHCEDNLSGAVGIRNAKKEPLFLEQYLDKSAEQQISSLFQQPVSRDDIVEIGNLVATRRGGSYLLFVILASVLYEAGYRWVICTATNHVEHIIRKMKFESDVLCEAKPEKLKENADIWGSYYANKPRVLVGDIRKAYQEIQNSPLLKAMISPYQLSISQTAMALLESAHDK